LGCHRGEKWSRGHREVLFIGAGVARGAHRHPNHNPQRNSTSMGDLESNQINFLFLSGMIELSSTWIRPLGNGTGSKMKPSPGRRVHAQ
jgi:hypothetical protein